MARKRRTAEQARAEIIEIAAGLLEREGPDAVRVARVAEEMGVSHPAILHHFGCADGLREALYRQISIDLRVDALSILENDPRGITIDSLEAVLERLADPKNGKMMAWLLVNGRDPFPDAGEQGLASILGLLSQGKGLSTERRYKLMLVLLAMYGESLLGDHVRSRLGVDDEADPANFRRWLLRLVIPQSD